MAEVRQEGETISNRGLPYQKTGMLRFSQDAPEMRIVLLA